MQYEFRSTTLTGALRKSLAPQQSRLERKFSTTIESSNSDYNRETISLYVQGGRDYRINWNARKAAGDGGEYSIEIASHDGYGHFVDSFSYGGSWAFRANVSGQTDFTIGILRSFGALWSSYPVDIDID